MCVGKYRLYTDVEVSMGFTTPTDEVARFINAIATKSEKFNRLLP